MEQPKEPPNTVYVVNELRWEWTDEWYSIQNDEPVKAFVSLRDAEQYRLNLERIREEEMSAPEIRNRGWYTPNTENHVPEPFYEVVAVEIDE